MVAFNTEKIIQALSGVDGAKVEAVTKNDSHKFINSIYTQNDESDNTSSASTKKTPWGIKALIKAAKAFLKSIVTPNKTVNATRTATEHTATSAALTIKTTDKISYIKQMAELLLENAGEYAEELGAILSNLQSSTQTVENIQEEIQSLEQQIEAKKTEYENETDKNRKAELAEELHSLTTNLKGLTDDLLAINQEVENMKGAIEKIQQNLNETTKNTELLAEKGEDAVKDYTAQNTELAAAGAESETGSIVNSALCTTGTEVTTGLTAAGAATAGTTAALAVKTGEGAVDCGTAAGVQSIDFTTVLSSVLTVGNYIATLASVNNNYNGNLVSTIYGANTLVGAFNTQSNNTISSIGSSNNEAMKWISCINAIGSMLG